MAEKSKLVKYIQLRFSKDEYRVVEKRAKKESLTIPAYVMRLLLARP